jgi:hypothetical protein
MLRSGSTTSCSSFSAKPSFPPPHRARGLLLRSNCGTALVGESFVTQAWRDGPFGAFRMGVEHGGWCVGSGWALLASLFALGVMSIPWMILVAGLIAVEKLLPRKTVAKSVSRDRAGEPRTRSLARATRRAWPDAARLPGSAGDDALDVRHDPCSSDEALDSVGTVSRARRNANAGLIIG